MCFHTCSTGFRSGAYGGSHSIRNRSTADKPDEPRGRSTDWQSTQAQLDAWHYAQEVVRDRLRSPSSADFGGQVWSLDEHCRYVQGRRYSVHGWVDASNGFGSTERLNWRVLLECETKSPSWGDWLDGKWQVIEAVVTPR